MQAGLWWGAAACAVLAGLSHLAEDRRHRRRRGLDQVGLVPWLPIQLVAIGGAVMLAAFALSKAG